MKSAGKILACRLAQKKNSSEEIKNLLKSTEKKISPQIPQIGAEKKLYGRNKNLRKSAEKISACRLGQKKNFMEEIKNLRKNH